MKFALVYPDDVDAIWPDVEQYISAACRHCSDHPEDLREQLKSCRNLILVVIYDEAAIIGAMILQQLPVSIHIREMGGDLPAGWEPDLDRWLAGLARCMGKTQLTANGRRGWDRKLRSPGWLRIDDTLIREV